MELVVKVDEGLALFVNMLIAVGTIGSVVVSLYLARANSKPKMVVQVGQGIAAPGYLGSNVQMYFSMEIMNEGFIPVTISGLGVRVDKFKYSMIPPVNGMTTTFPVKIESGSLAQVYAPYDGFVENLALVLDDHMRRRKSELFGLPRLGVYFQSASGKCFEALLDKSYGEQAFEFLKSKKGE